MAVRYVGVDGCARGWALAELVGGRPTGYRLCPDFAGVLEHVRGARLVLVDIPIGLPDAARPHRLCDVEARRELGRRGCCVFAAPIREVLEPSGWEAASARRIRLQRWYRRPRCAGSGEWTQSWE